MGFLQRLFGTDDYYDDDDYYDEYDEYEEDGYLEELIGSKEKEPPEKEPPEKEPLPASSPKEALRPPAPRIKKLPIDDIDREQEVVSCCERIMDHTSQMRDAKAQYDVISDYLKDAEKIDDLPDGKRMRLIRAAQDVENVSAQRDELLERKSKIPESRRALFDSMGDDMVDQLERLKSNESYQALVKRDMQRLEGERHSWIVEIEESKNAQKILRRSLYILMGIFIAWIIIYLVLLNNISGRYIDELKFAMLIVSALVAALGFASYLRFLNRKTNQKKARRALNKSIVLLNQMKAKYVTITNAVDYAYEKYDIHSSHELSYLWEQYLKAKKEEEEFERTGDELDAVGRELKRVLEAMEIDAVNFWAIQTRALIDRREMVEVRHHMGARG